MIDSKPDNFIKEEPDRRPQEPENIFAPAPDATAPQSSQPEVGADHPKHKHRHRWAIFGLLVLVALGVAVWLRYFNPYIVDARATGYIVNVEKRGLIFKTFEGTMTTVEAMADENKLYKREMVFSVDNDSIARAIQALQGTGRSVTMEYKRYYATVPWRGASTIVATGIVAEEEKEKP